MENYVRVRPPRAEDDASKSDPNEVRITANGKVKHYISYSVASLTEREQPAITLRAMGKAINKTVAIAEIVKRRVSGLHQNTVLFTEDVTDVWEPKEGTEGLDRIETTRHGAVIRITLSKEPLDENAVGYQPPLPEEEVKPLDDEAGLAGEMEGAEGRGRRTGRGRGRGRGRGGGRRRGQQQGSAGNKDEMAEAAEGAEPAE